MEIPTTQDLIALMAEHEGPHVSLFMPTHMLGSEIQEDRIHLKNLLTVAEDGLVETGMRRTIAKDMLAPVAALEHDTAFWQHQAHGLAIFISEAGIHQFRVPRTLPEMVLVEPRFHLKPLLPLLSAGVAFHVLAISSNRTHLLACTPTSQAEVTVEGMPAGIGDVLWPDDTEKQSQFLAFDQGASGHTGVFYGAGSSEPKHKDELLRYCQQVDRALVPYMVSRGDPMVLACVDYLADIYRQANSYAHLSEAHVSGSPDRILDERLRAAAWELLRPGIDAEREAALARYRQLAGTGQTTSDIAEAALAAVSGKIDTVFVTVSRQRWGRIDTDAYKVELHDDRATDDYDLLDTIAGQALLAGGTVYAVEEAEAPEPTGVAAVFRYAG